MRPKHIRNKWWHNIDLKKRFREYPQEFIRVSEAMEIVKKSASTIKLWCSVGEIGCVKSGATKWIWRPSLLDMIKDE